MADELNRIMSTEVDAQTWRAGAPGASEEQGSSEASSTARRQCDALKPCMRGRPLQHAAQWLRCTRQHHPLTPQSCSASGEEGSRLRVNSQLQQDRVEDQRAADALRSAAPALQGSALAGHRAAVSPGTPAPSSMRCGVSVVRPVRAGHA
jgi:hypothetical protein